MTLARHLVELLSRRACLAAFGLVVSLPSNNSSTFGVSCLWPYRRDACRKKVSVWKILNLKTTVVFHSCVEVRAVSFMLVQFHFSNIAICFVAKAKSSAATISQQTQMLTFQFGESIPEGDKRMNTQKRVCCQKQNQTEQTRTSTVCRFKTKQSSI